MREPPSESFRWGVLLRASKGQRVTQPDGSIKFVAETIDRQDLELIEHIRDSRMGVVVDSYKDVASGWKPGAKRPRYIDALSDLETGRIAGIACLAVDRLTRRRDQVRPILNAVERMEGRLFFLWDELDTASDDPDTELKLHTLVARAEAEAQRTSQRYKLAARHRAKKGLPQNGSRQPYGHRYIPAVRDSRNKVLEDGYLVLNEPEAEVLNEAAKRVAAGEAIFTIARDFTERGIPTATGKTTWQHDVLRQMLLSARMVCKRDYNDATIDLRDPVPILDAQLWQQVRDKLTPKQRAGRRENRLLSNLALCGSCGLSMVGDTDDGAKTYACKKRPAEPGACGGVVVRAALADAKVDRELVAFLNDRPRVEALLERYRLNDPDQTAIDARFAELQDAKLALEDDRYRPPQGRKPLDADTYWTRRTAIEDDQEALQRQRVISREAEPLRAALKVEWTEQEWKARPLEYRRAILHIACERIEVAPTLRRGAVKGHLGAVHNPERVRLTFADE